MTPRCAIVDPLQTSLPWPGEPMLCRSAEQLPQQHELGATVAYELKFDGFLY